ncbi:MAG: DUF4974 domain-containing protein [Cyclobacteriaceae bacterium]
MKYENYSVWDFVEDDYFVTWVKDSPDQTNQFWEKWLMHHPHKADDVQMARHIINNIKYTETPRPSEHDLVDVFENIVRGRQYAEKQDNRKKVVSFRNILKYAAVLMIAFAGVSAWYLIPKGTPSNTVAKVNMVKKKNPRGMKSTVWLNDGTKVILNAETSLKYPEYFNDSIRMVFLSGEAFFEVERDTLRPFVIVSNNIETTVLGTSFNIRSYSEEKEVSVGVVTGRVQVTNRCDSGISFQHDLMPNQMSVVNFDLQQATKREFDPSEVIAWKDWTLKFKNQPLKKIFSELEKWYAVDLVVDANVDLQQTYSGSFDNESLKVVLEVLAHNAEFDFELTEKKARIFK